jgi:hypothetical protein
VIAKRMGGAGYQRLAGYVLNVKREHQPIGIALRDHPRHRPRLLPLDAGQAHPELRCGFVMPGDNR